MDVSFLRTGEQLIRVHRFRYVTAQGCAIGSVEIVVEETLGPASPAERPCTARPDHPRLVAKSEYTFQRETVEAALQSCVERLRSRPLSEAFLPAS